MTPGTKSGGGAENDKISNKNDEIEKKFPNGWTPHWYCTVLSTVHTEQRSFEGNRNLEP